MDAAVLADIPGDVDINVLSSVVVVDETFVTEQSDDRRVLLFCGDDEADRFSLPLPRSTLNNLVDILLLLFRC